MCGVPGMGVPHFCGRVSMRVAFGCLCAAERQLWSPPCWPFAHGCCDPSSLLMRGSPVHVLTVLRLSMQRLLALPTAGPPCPATLQHQAAGARITLLLFRANRVASHAMQALDAAAGAHGGWTAPAQPTQVSLGGAGV